MWSDEMVPVVRLFMSDDAIPYTYSDTKIEYSIVIAAGIVLSELDFPVTYTVDRSTPDISPDPTVDPYRDDNFINLVCAKAACLVDRGSASKSAGQAIKIRDGSSEIDLRDAFKAKLELLKQGWCSVYDDMKLEYITNQGSVVVGAAILSPFGLGRSGHYQRSFR